MFYLELSGTPYEIGFQHGRSLRLMIGSMIDYLAQSVRRWDDAKIESARRKRMAYTEKRYPELIEEVQGIVDGSGFPFKWIYLTNFYAALVVQCTNVIFTDTPNGPVHGRTTDLPVHEGKHSGVALIRPRGGPAYLTLLWPGCAWRGPVVTEAGLSIGGSSCTTTLPTPPEFFNCHAVTGYLVRKCETVRDAIALLADLPLTGYGGSYAFTDSSGDAAIAEKAGLKMGVRRPERSRLWCSNIPFSSEMKPYGPKDPEMIKESQERFEAIRRLTENRPLDIKLMKDVLAYSGRPGAICRYGDDDPLGFETETAQIMRPSEGVMEVCLTHPDRDPWWTFSIKEGWREADR